MYSGVYANISIPTFSENWMNMPNGASLMNLHAATKVVLPSGGGARL